jgi:hypothetical protein
MYCPRCGAENDEANRFCVACGSSLAPEKPKAGPKPTLPERIRGLVGTTPRARLLTGLTILAIVVAVVAFLVLKPADETVAQDAYLRGLDRECVAEKERVSQAETETLRQRPPDLEAFASVLVTIAAEWHGAVAASAAPPEHAAAAAAYETALLELLMRSGTLARLSREGRNAKAIGKGAAAVEGATAEVDAAASGLGLERCPGVNVTPAVGS